MCVSTWESRHSSQSVRRGQAGTFVASGSGAGASIRRGRGNRDIKGRVGNMQSRSFTFLRTTLGVTWWRGIALGASSMSWPTACWKLWWWVRVHSRVVVWAGMNCLFPLRTWRGKKWGASGGLQQTFSSLCALERHKKEEERGKEKERNWWDEAVRLTRANSRMFNRISEFCNSWARWIKGKLCASSPNKWSETRDHKRFMPWICMERHIRPRPSHLIVFRNLRERRYKVVSNINAAIWLFGYFSKVWFKAEAADAEISWLLVTYVSTPDSTCPISQLC